MHYKYILIFVILHLVSFYLYDYSLQNDIKNEKLSYDDNLICQDSENPLYSKFQRNHIIRKLVGKNFCRVLLGASAHCCTNMECHKTEQLILKSKHETLHGFMKDFSTSLNKNKS